VHINTDGKAKAYEHIANGNTLHNTAWGSAEQIFMKKPTRATVQHRRCMKRMMNPEKSVSTGSRNLAIFAHILKHAYSNKKKRMHARIARMTKLVIKGRFRLQKEDFVDSSTLLSVVKRSTRVGGILWIPSLNVLNIITGVFFWFLGRKLVIKGAVFRRL
jgi:hypothetical protein